LLSTSVVRLTFCEAASEVDERLEVRVVIVSTRPEYEPHDWIVLERFAQDIDDRRDIVGIQ